MSRPDSLSHPLDIVRLAFKYPLRWILPAVIVAGAAIWFAKVTPETWEASQQLVVRNEAASNQDGPGRFRTSEELKALLEAVLELSRSQVVLAEAMKAVDKVEPTEIAVSEMADRVKLIPPKGGEFGKTELLYLKVKDQSRKRAVALCAAICDQLELRFRELRNARAQSMVDELTRTRELAQEDVVQAIGRMQAVEQSVGADLAELRNLQNTASGVDSDLRRRSVEMESELRQATIDERQRNEWVKVLEAARQSPAKLLALPGALPERLPTLLKLKQSLLEAQLRTAQLKGTMTAEHPFVIASIIGEAEIAQHFDQELASAIHGAQVDWRLAAERVERLKQDIPALRSRLDRLASLRSEYARLSAEVENVTRLRNEAESALVHARAGLAGGEVASLITRVDVPFTGPKPVGPGKTTVMAAGVLGGLIVGFGVLLLSIQTTPRPDDEERQVVDRPRIAERDTAPNLSVLSALRKVAPG